MSAEPIDAGGTPAQHPAPAPAPTVHFDVAPQDQVVVDSTKDVIMQDKDESPELGQIECAAPTFLHSPPDSNNVVKSDPSDSELSDLEGDVSDPAPAPAPDSAPKPAEVVDDIGDVEPDHYTDGVPVFKPTMHQFKDFRLFMDKVNDYGMKSGIIKICPPDEWRKSQPPLNDLVKTIRVREPIKQEIMGSNGTYRQVNFLHGRVYTLRQWRELCEQSEHQPPSRRGERRMNFDRSKPAPRPKPATTAKKPAPGGTEKRRRGRPPKNRPRAKEAAPEVKEEDRSERPITPVSDKHEGDDGQANEKGQSSRDDNAKFAETDATGVAESVKESVETGAKAPADDEGTPSVRRMGAVRQKEKTQSTSARRKFSRREGSAMIDEEHFKGWDYKMDVSGFTRERCEELERVYWKTLTYAPPLYGADLMGTLFDDRTDIWNLNKLPNLLDVLGTKVPGVNTAYLYMGMWKATFAWHLEDVDLYSINYLHFGAPKQWYSISQGDARRFETAMKSIWPTEAKACDQFLRHKSFLISPSRLLQNYNIKVNKCVSYPGEFVVTYPYGYHSGYNLGYNCAEAVNFALDSWLPMGKIAKKCECAQAQDSVWIDVDGIERKLRGEETEYEETEDEEEDEDEDGPSSLLTPPASHSTKSRVPSRKRKRTGEKDGRKKVKKVRLRVKAKAEPPCCLCPHDIPHAEILPTSDGRKAHRMCALYLPETYIEAASGEEVVENVGGITKERLELKCLYCRSKKGACFQCSQEKCTRSYHATCAAAAGVFVEEADVPVYGEDGKEYKEQAFEFSCRFHRTKRDRRLDGDKLESEPRIRDAAKALKEGDICQLQYYRGDIFAGVVVENRHDEETLLLDIIPKGDHVEVEWKWLLVADPADYHLPKASPNAIPMPSSRKAKNELNAKRAEDEAPRKGTEFVPGYTWTEFSSFDAKNKEQAKVDMDKEQRVWYYLGKPSTDAKAQYTEDPSKPRHNPKSNFLDTIPKPPRPMPVPAPRRPSVASSTSVSKTERPYVYKPRIPAAPDLPVNRWQSPAQRWGSTSTPAPSSPFTTQHFQPLPYVPTSTTVPASSAITNTTMPLQRTWPTQQASMQAPRPAATTVPGPGHATFSQATPTVQSRYGSFFHRHLNRDSHRFRTPYSQFGGYTNGYEGNLLAYLMKGGTLFNGASHNPKGQQPASTPGMASSSSARSQSSYQAQYSPPLPVQTQTPTPTQMQTQMQYKPWPASLPNVNGASSASNSPSAAGATAYDQSHGQSSTQPMHSAKPLSIPTQSGSPPATGGYGTSVPTTKTTHSSSPAPPSELAGREAAAVAAAAPGQNEFKTQGPPIAQTSKMPKYKIPARESPVPLPAKYLAAMKGSRGSPAGSPSPSTMTAAKSMTPSPTEGATPLLPPIHKPTITPVPLPTTVNPMTTTTPSSTPKTPVPTPKPGSGEGSKAAVPVSVPGPVPTPQPAPKISTTPVPLPPIPGLVRTIPAAKVQKSCAPQTNGQGAPSSNPGSLSTTIAIPPQPSATTATSTMGPSPSALDVELADIPTDSSAFVEKIVMNLRRASGSVT